MTGRPGFLSGRSTLKVEALPGFLDRFRIALFELRQKLGPARLPRLVFLHELGPLAEVMDFRRDALDHATLHRHNEADRLASRKTYLARTRQLPVHGERKRQPVGL